MKLEEINPKDYNAFSNENLASFEDLKEKTLRDIYIPKLKDYILFQDIENIIYCMRHINDCCEYVILESITGDLEDIIGAEIFVAEERTNKDLPPIEPCDYSYTWTFYTIRTIKGTFDMRWFGTSNGCYSEEVDFYKLNKPRKLPELDCSKVCIYIN